MKKIRLIFSQLFILFLTVFVFAQTEKPQSINSNKIALVNTAVFQDEKAGIKEFIAVYKKLDEEFKPQIEELKILQEKVKKLIKEIEEFTSRCKSGMCCGIRPESVLDTLEEYNLSINKFKSKQEEAKSVFDKRKAELTADINKKIAEALKQFAKEKGYALILDSSKLDDSFTLGSKDSDSDVTEDFIKYYNENFGKFKSQ